MDKGEDLPVRGGSEEESRCGPPSRGPLWKLIFPGNKLAGMEASYRIGGHSFLLC